MPLVVLSPYLSNSNAIVDQEEIAHIMKTKSEYRKSCYEKIYHVNVPIINFEDYVRIKEFRRKNKFSNVFSNELFELDKLVGKNAIKLNDGRVMNSRDCIYVKLPIIDDVAESQLIDLSEGQTRQEPAPPPVPVHRRSARFRKPVVRFSPHLEWGPM